MRISRAGFLGLAAVFALGLLFGGAGAAQAKKKKPKKPEFLYVHDYSTLDNRVYGFQVAAAGTLTALPGSPFSTGDSADGCGGDCGSLAYAAGGRLLFVAGENGITVFTVGADGVLTKVLGSPFGGFDAGGVATVTLNGKTFVYGTDWSAAEIHGFEAAVDGTLTPVPNSPAATGAGPLGLAVTGNRLIVANELADTLVPYTIGNDGSLTIVNGGAAVSLGTFFVDADGKFVYAVDGGNKLVRGFELNAAGQLLNLAGAPFPAGVAGTAGLALGKGKLMYVLAPVAAQANAQALKQDKQGRLTPLGAAQDLGHYGLNTGALNSTGKLLAVAGGGKIAVYKVNSKSGNLTQADLENVDLEANHTNGALFVQ